MYGILFLTFYLSCFLNPIVCQIPEWDEFILDAIRESSNSLNVNNIPSDKVTNYLLNLDMNDLFIHIDNYIEVRKHVITESFVNKYFNHHGYPEYVKKDINRYNEQYRLYAIKKIILYLSSDTMAELEEQNKEDSNFQLLIFSIVEDQHYNTATYLIHKFLRYNSGVSCDANPHSVEHCDYNALLNNIHPLGDQPLGDYPTNDKAANNRDEAIQHVLYGKIYIIEYHLGHVLRNGHLFLFQYMEKYFHISATTSSLELNKDAIRSNDIEIVKYVDLHYPTTEVEELFQFYIKTKVNIDLLLYFTYKFTELRNNHNVNGKKDIVYNINILRNM